MRQDVAFVERELDAVRTVVVTGACRSGKTTFGNIVATARNVEYADEPWSAMMLPMIVGAGAVDRNFARLWFRNLVGETFNDLALLRTANFRPGDLSSIWTKKTPAEIFERLVEVRGRADIAKLADANTPVLALTLSECGSFSDFVNESLDDVTIVHVIRNGFDVAHDVECKAWFSDEQLYQPHNAQLYAAYSAGGRVYHLPWWVDAGDEAFFLSLNDYERGLYYWASLIEKTEAAGVDLRVVRFDALTGDTGRTIADEFEALGLVAGPLTNGEICKVAPPTRRDPRHTHSALGERVQALCERYDL